MQRIYVCKVKGEYITERGEEKVLRSYRATFRLPNADKPLSTVRGKLLMPFLRKLDAYAIAPVSWHLEEIRPESGEFDPDELPIMFQSIKQLKMYCIRHKLQVPVEEYSDLDLARAHVELALVSPEGFKQVYEKHAERIREEKELDELNRGFNHIGESGPEIEVDTASGKVIERVDTSDIQREELAQPAVSDEPVIKKKRGRKPKKPLTEDGIEDEAVFG